MFSCFRTRGVVVVHRHIFNQEQMAFGIKRMTEVCALNQRDALPVLSKVVIFLGNRPTDFGGLRSKVSRIQIFDHHRFIIQAADTVAALDALAQMLYAELKMPISANDILRGITEHG